MKAILVSVSLMTRIIVDDDFDTDEIRDQDYDTIREKAYPRLLEALRINGVGDSLDEVVEDTECPFGTFDEDGSNLAQESNNKRTSTIPEDYMSFSVGN